MKLSPPPVVSSSNPFLPTLSTTAKLFGVGLTAGPIVDSLHNQVLLTYDTLPIEVPNPITHNVIFASSWTVPPLLGVAYVVLGGVLPRLFQWLEHGVRGGDIRDEVQPSHLPSRNNDNSAFLRNRAILAVTTTAMIIKLTELLETFQILPSDEWNVRITMLAALLQWATLDGTLPSLLAAWVTSIGGPLSELPFVAHDVWQYLPQVSNYVPLANVNDGSIASFLLEPLLGHDFQHLSLCSISGPCYFAVTMDAIAFGRWFDDTEEDGEET